MHICWGNYEGPHDHDIALEKFAADRAQGEAAGDPVRGREPAPSARMGRVARQRSCPTTRSWSRAAVASTSNYVEHPELVAEQLCRFADIVGRERVSRAPIAASAPSPVTALDPAIAFKKLAMAEGAAIATDTSMAKQTVVMKRRGRHPTAAEVRAGSSASCTASASRTPVAPRTSCASSSRETSPARASGSRATRSPSACSAARRFRRAGRSSRARRSVAATAAIDRVLPRAKAPRTRADSNCRAGATRSRRSMPGTNPSPPQRSRSARRAAPARNG